MVHAAWHWMASRGQHHRIMWQQPCSHTKAHSKGNASPNQLFCVLALSPFITGLSSAMLPLLMWKTGLTVINQWETGFLWTLRGFTWTCKDVDFIFFQGDRKRTEATWDLNTPPPPSHTHSPHEDTENRKGEFLGTLLVSFLQDELPNNLFHFQERKQIRA